MPSPHFPFSIFHFPFPPLPAVARKVLDAHGDDDAAIDEVATLIGREPALLSRILQLVENPAGVAGDAVGGGQNAVALPGFAAVRAAVLAVSVFQLLDALPGGGGRFARAEFWEHSLAVACCAELLAEQPHRLNGRDSGVSCADAFVCGLVHDMGKIALDSLLPKSFARVVEAADLQRGDIADFEREIIGVDHLLVGKRLAEHWNLPPAVLESVWLHGQMPAALPATVQNPRLVSLITLADLLVRQQGLGYSGNYLFPVSREELAAAVGLNDAAVDAAVAGLAGRMEKRQAALALDGDSAAASGEQTPVASEAMDPHSPLVVMQAIAPTAQELLAGSAAVFSLSPVQAVAEVLLCGGGDAQSLRLDCPHPPALPAGGDGPALAGDDLDWLLSAISPRLDGEYRYWICLDADSQCIGGVVWGGAAGDAQRVSAQVPDLPEIARWWALALQTSQMRQEAKFLAEQLAEAQRQLQSAQSQSAPDQMLTALGEIAAGAAHEMNNPLAVISGRSQLLAGQLADPRQRVMAQQIFEQSQRLSDIISDLMDYAKPPPAKPVPCAVAELIAQASQLAKSKDDPADRNIELDLGDTPTVMVDAAQVSAALAEILLNACQATEPAGGQVKIQSAFDPHSNRVAITIADNGCGMDEHVLKHAFDPFFSSRQAGRRRGMGLAKALRWVEASGGVIRLESRPMQGTRCLILLPAEK